MNSYVNYVVEANIGLILFMAAYIVLLAKETNFSLQRFFLIAAIIASLTFPLIHLSFSDGNIPSLSRLLPSSFLPELMISDQAAGNAASTTDAGFDMWLGIALFYGAGLLVSFSLFTIRLIQLTRKLTGNSFSAVGKYKVIESSGHRHTFSFFNYIFLGQADELSIDEKQRILQHETIHARQLHSLDVLLVNITGVLFWFNPIIKTYKKIFIQLHEFEADARAVEDRDVNDYCTLLAKVALQSADFRLANHFNNSLTLKRIKMMRTLKQKIKTWKILAFAGVIPLVFFLVACQDQVMNDITALAKNSNNALVVPDDVQARYETLKRQNPNSKYILVEFNEAAEKKLEGMVTINDNHGKIVLLRDEAEKQLAGMESKYGAPKHIEFYTPDATPLSGVKTFAIIEYDDLMNDISNQSKLDGDVYTVVEDTAIPNGGLPKFYEHIAKKMLYPAEARKNGIVGKVFVEFVVQPDGSLTNIKTLKGIGMGCDEEAMRAIASYPDKWIPGKNGGVDVKQRMVLPITFKLDGQNGTSDNNVTAPEGSINELVVVGANPKFE